MLNFAQSVSAVRKAGVTARSFSGNPKLSGDVLSVEDGANILIQAAKDKMAADPSFNAIQIVNDLARTPQWSSAMGRAAAAKAMEWARRYAAGLDGGSGYAPGFLGGTAHEYTGKRSAYEQIEAIGKRLREADPSLSEAGSFMKAYFANPELAKADKAERMEAIRKASA